MARDNDMISPFEDKQVRGDKISFGVSSYGYDARVSDEFKIFTNVNSEIVVIRTYFPLLIQLNTYLFRNIFHVYLRCKNINNNVF